MHYSFTPGKPAKEYMMLWKQEEIVLDLWRKIELNGKLQQYLKRLIE